MKRSLTKTRILMAPLLAAVMVYLTCPPVVSQEQLSEEQISTPVQQLDDRAASDEPASPNEISAEQPVITQDPHQQIISELSEKFAALAPEDTEAKLALAAEAEAAGADLFAEAAFNQSKQAFEIAYDLRTQVSNQPDASLLPTMIGLSKCNVSLEQYNDAVSTYQSALAIADAAATNAPSEELRNHQEQILSGLVAAFLLFNQPDEAASYGKRAYELARTTFGATSLQALWAAAQLSETMRASGSTKQAETFNHEIFNICLERAGGRTAILASSQTQGTSDTTEAVPIRFWHAPVEPKAVLLCVHGMSLHSGNYSEFAEQMSKTGFLVIGLDVRGLGSWIQSEGQTYLNLDACLEDIRSLINELNALTESKPIFLVGESMGGGVVLHAAANIDGIAGVVSVVPGAQRYSQKSETARVAVQITARGMDSYMDVSKNILPRAMSDPTVRRQWSEDPLAKRYLSPRELLSFQNFMSHNADSAKQITNTPVLIVQGMRDRLVKPEATERIYSCIAATDKTMMTLADREHLILELGQFTPEILSRLTRWLDSHLTPPALAQPSADKRARVHDIRNYACYYGEKFVPALASYNLAIVQPDNITDEQLTYLKQHGTIVVAYLTIGEADSLDGVDKSWIINENKDWKSYRIDSNNVGWHAYVLRKAKSIMDRGFDGLFLDTVDVGEEFPRTKPGMLQLIRNLRAAFTDAILVQNRGLQLCNESAPFIDALMFEDLCTTYDFNRKRYIPIDNSEEAERLSAFAQKSGVKILSLDYADPTDVRTAQRCMNKARSYRFVPFVSVINLDRLPSH